MGGNGEGEMGRGETGRRDRDGETGRGRSSGKGQEWGGEKGRVRLGGGNGKGEMGKGRGEEGARGGDFIDGYDESLGGMRLQFFLTLFIHATPGTPPSISIKVLTICSITNCKQQNVQEVFVLIIFE